MPITTSRVRWADNTAKRAVIIGIQTAVTIGAVAEVSLCGLHISTALTGTCVIAGFSNSAGAAASITLPIGSVGFKDFGGMVNDQGSLTVTCSTVGDANFVTVIFVPV